MIVSCHENLIFVTIAQSIYTVAFGALVADRSMKFEIFH